MIVRPVLQGPRLKLCAVIDRDRMRARSTIEGAVERERGFADAQRPADVADGRATLGLAQRVGDLFLGEFRALHRSPPIPGGPPKPSHSTVIFICRRFVG